jgi:hypothetical protein
MPNHFRVLHFKTSFVLFIVHQIQFTDAVADVMTRADASFRRDTSVLNIDTDG